MTPNLRYTKLYFVHVCVISSTHDGSFALFDNTLSDDLGIFLTQTVNDTRLIWVRLLNPMSDVSDGFIRGVRSLYYFVDKIWTYSFFLQ